MNERGSAPDTTVSGWSRLLGVSVRPWAGASPLSLIVRGAVQLTVCVVLSIAGARLLWGPDAASFRGEAAAVHGVLVVIFLTLIVVTAVGALRLVVGMVDLVPRTSYSGVVVSLRGRKVFDVLPRPAQRLIFERGPNAIDKRRLRTEVVVETESGLKQWTVTRSDVLRTLRVGSRVLITVTPLAGHVAKAEALT